MESQIGMARNTGPGLYEFLMEAELQQYYPGIQGDLKVQTTAQLKFVTEDDLHGIGMSKPEMRRLKKYFQKHYPQNYLSKFKKMLLPKREEHIACTLTTLSEERQDKAPIRVPNKHMIPADAIIVNKELGTGEFGIVQQGVWTNDGERIQVAIKCLSRERMQNNPIEFLKEAAIMHSIDHEHIVRLYGVVLDTNSLMLVTELAPLRSLLECLKEPSLRSSFPILSLCEFAIQIADGMQYLEIKRLIHRDLAARNILVFSKNKVKISDFGLSRALGVGKDYYQTNFNVNLKLPIAWCAPESIKYLKFTSASDIWAYGVTLWEMFSYGFQPWPALTGHQILEAIDEPNFQRLEQPECCPKDYYSFMLKCWQHEPTKRPKFSDLVENLPDLKPEQVQAVQDFIEPEQLAYRQGDVITVLDRENSNGLWKGVLSNGKTGYFNPAHTIAYLGSNLPSNKPGELIRGGGNDGKNVFSSQRRKIRTDMISSPQGDLKHTGHVGLDGAYFGDVGFLGGKYPHLPRQVVTPYKPQEDVTDNCCGQFLRNVETKTEKRTRQENLWSDFQPPPGHLLGSGGSADHEYHEISDEENQDSPSRFDKVLNFDFGPSLLDEMDQMFKSLGESSSSSSVPSSNHHQHHHHHHQHQHQHHHHQQHQNLASTTEHESINARNELREIQSKQCNKKKQATVSPINVKPISAADQKTLYSAIAMAQELTARSMTDLEHPPESPRTPVSPSRRRKFSFKLPHQHSPKPDRRHFSEEAASIPDIQATLSEEAKEVYNSLVETQSMENNSDTNPLRMLRSGLPMVVRPRIKSINKQGCPNNDDPPDAVQSGFYSETNGVKSKIQSSCNDLDLENNVDENPIPLPPRDRSKSLQPKASLQRHQRKHPLIIPGGGITRTLARMASSSSSSSTLEDQVDSVLKPQNEDSEDVEKISIQDNSQQDSTEEFERSIDSELETLDSLPIQKTQSNSSEDLFSSTDGEIMDEQDKSTDDSSNKEMNETNEQCIPSSTSKELSRQSDHVSCEDLLEFACDQPNSRRTRGPRNGEQSDEVRIMLKVLHEQSTPESCVAALNVTNWNVLAAIKLERLQSLLRKDNRFVSLEDCKVMLNECGGDVVKAAAMLRSLDDPAAV